MEVRNVVDIAVQELVMSVKVINIAMKDFEVIL